MTNEPEQLPETPAPAPPFQDPERGAWLATTFGRIVRLAAESLAAELLAPSSTDSLSLADRALMSVLRANTPRLQATLYSRLSSLDPAQLELSLGAVAETVNELLAAAPGEPMPRHVLRVDADRRWSLAPVAVDG